MKGDIMSEIKINNIVGDKFEDMSIAEMTMVQGSGDDISGEITTSPACVALSVAFSQHSSAKCASAASAISGAISGAIISAVKC